ncbi:YfcC family protein [Endozoicomonas arenosclerae]|uniref:YfcC family protein n=1 Tax=Endozoicomonas arenosclerae TaxID=1633495 RepID=UPI00078303E1|nr:YfcC family protein [Endozoicomonas arenosclerae]
MNSSTLAVSRSPEKKRFEFPDIYIILLFFIVLVGVLSWFIPAGQYERETLANGRESVVPGSYQQIEQTPVGPMDIIEAIPAGIEGAAAVVVLTLLVGGAVIVLQRIGVVDMGINLLLQRIGSRTELMIPILVLVFGAIAAFIGTPELSLAYIPIILPLMLRLGYDSMTAAATAIMPCTLGFAFGITAPTTVGIGHLITGLPMFSGAGYRVMFWAIIMFSTTVFILRYARRVKASPASSSMYVDDQKLRQELLSEETTPADHQYSTSLKLAGIVTLMMFIGIVAAIIIFGLGFNAISGLFLTMAVIASLIAGRSGNQICADFNDAMKVMLPGAIISGVARGVSVTLEAGNTMDTLVFYLATLISQLPEWAMAVGVVISQTSLNFLIPAGSGQMLVTLPVLSPVAELVGMNQQVLVWSSNVADGISNIFFPTSGYFIAALVAARVDYIRWIRFYTPFFIFTLGVASFGAVVANAIDYGPF